MPWPREDTLGPQLFVDIVQGLDPAFDSPVLVPDERSGMLELGLEGMPTMGSTGHYLRTCKPCAFVNTKGCKDGAWCNFCHLCEPGEKKRRKKEKKAFQQVGNSVCSQRGTLPQEQAVGRAVVALGAA